MRKRKFKRDDQLLRSILATESPTYYEGELGSLYMDTMSGVADAVGRDVLGNVSASILGASYGSRIMISAHQDEVGVVVDGHTDSGYATLSPVGYIDPASLQGSMLSLTTPSGEKLVGVVLRPPVHALKDEEITTVPPVEECLLDVGATSREEVEKLCPIETYGVWKTEVVEAPSGRLFARAADNKLSVYVLTRVMQELAKERASLPAKVFGVLTAAEEDKGSTAVCAARKIDPAINIVLDVYPCGPFDSLEGDLSGEYDFNSVVISNGPFIHKKLFDFAVSAAKKLRIPYSTPYSADITGTDLEDLRLVNGGSACCLLGVPVRMLHTPFSLFSPAVLESLVALVVKVVLSITDLKL